MKKIFLLIIILICGIASADYMSESYINNTYKNITIFVDIPIVFDALIDNSSGIYFLNISILKNDYLYNCSDYFFEEENNTYYTNDFPLGSWNCTSIYINPPTTQIIKEYDTLFVNYNNTINWTINGSYIEKSIFNISDPNGTLIYSSTDINGSYQILNVSMGHYTINLYAENGAGGISTKADSFEVTSFKSETRLAAEKVSVTLIAAMGIIGIFILVAVFGFFVSVFKGNVSVSLLFSTAITIVGIAIAIIIFYVVQNLLLNLM